MNYHLDHAKPDYSEQDHVEPNQGLHRQTVMCRQKREDSMTEVNCHILPFFNFVHQLILLSSMMLQKLLFLSWGKEASNLTYPLDQAILSKWAP